MTPAGITLGIYNAMLSYERRLRGVLNKIKSCLPLEQRILCYNALIKPAFCYAGTAWQMSCSKDCLQRIFRFQKRPARVILDADPRTPSVPLFNRLHWLPFYVDTKVAQCCILYKRTQLAVPDNFIDSINLKSSRHTWNTRCSNYNFICPRYNRETEGGKTF